MVKPSISCRIPDRVSIRIFMEFLFLKLDLNLKEEHLYGDDSFGWYAVPEQQLTQEDSKKIHQFFCV